jgi:hypothetical protein
MNRPFTHEELLDAVGEFCDGRISDERGRRLDVLLASDPQARRRYANYMWLHACLIAEANSLLTSDEGTSSDDSSIEAAGSRALGDALRPSPSFLDRLRGKLDRAGLGGLLALAAALLGVIAWGGWTLGQFQARQGDESRLASGAAGKSVVGRITGTRNCLWRHPETRIGYGSPLVSGQTIELDEGLAELTFDDGVTVLLEGPATFDVDGHNAVRLEAGRLSAVVPDRARGFRISTAALDVFDAGAEYGVATLANGSSELHVFHGLVRADVLDGEGRRFKRLELTSSQAAKINPLSTSVHEFQADDAGFVRNIAPAAGPGDGLLAFEGFRYPEGPLEAQNGGFGWAGPWFNLSADEVAGPDSNQVRLGSLAAEGLVPVGNRAVVAAQYNRIRRALGTSVGGVFDAAGLVENKDEVRLIGSDGKVVYISFLQRVNKTDDGFYGFELHRGDGNGNRVLCIGNAADGAAYGATSNVNVYGAQNLPALGQENVDVNLFVIKITFGVDNHDLVEVLRNPESLRDEGACQVDAVLRGNFAFDRISLANFDGTKIQEIDEISVGTHFLAVTGRWGNNQGWLLRRVSQARGRSAGETAFTDSFDSTAGLRRQSGAALFPLALSAAGGIR